MSGAVAAALAGLLALAVAGVCREALHSQSTNEPGRPILPRVAAPHEETRSDPI